MYDIIPQHWKSDYILISIYLCIRDFITLWCPDKYNRYLPPSPDIIFWNIKLNLPVIDFANATGSKYGTANLARHPNRTFTHILSFCDFVRPNGTHCFQSLLTSQAYFIVIFSYSNLTIRLFNKLDKMTSLLGSKTSPML